MRLQVYNRQDSSTTEFEVNKREILVGTSSTNDIVLYQPSLSGRHLRIRLENGHAQVEDLESRTGTFVNGVRVKGTRVLEDGDTIGLGSYSISILMGAGGRERPRTGSLSGIFWNQREAVTTRPWYPRSKRSTED